MTINTEKLLGANVVYVGIKGLQKAAVVIGTPESTEEGHVLGQHPFTGENIVVPVPEPGHLNLMILSYTGLSPRFNVPFKDQAFDSLTLEVPEQQESDNPLLGEVGYWAVPGEVA